MKIAQFVLIAAAGRGYAECVAGDLEEEFASICIAIPLAITDKLWRFVYSQIPWKDTAVRGTMPYLISMALIASTGFFMVWRKAK